MKKQRKLSKSLDKGETNKSCRDLGRADHEGWLSKKAGGHGIMPVMWKRYWCAVKDGKLYCYKTSFDVAADYILLVKDYSVVNITEKKKIAFCMKPVSDGIKTAIFSGSTDEEVKQWIEILNKILSGVNVSQKDDVNVPDYEERKRVFSSSEKDSPKANRKRHSSAFQKETETTGLPTSFASRTSSLSQTRPRYGSLGGKSETVLSVGSMFKPLEETDDTASSQKPDDASDILYKESVAPELVVVEPPPKPTLDALLKEVEQLKTGTYHLQNQERNDPKPDEELHLQNQERNDPKPDEELEILDISVSVEHVPAKSEEVCVPAADSVEISDSTLASVAVQSPTSNEVFDVGHSLVTPAVDVDNNVEAVEKPETSVVETDETADVPLLVPLKTCGEMFYTGEEKKDVLPAATSEDATTIDASATLEVTAPASDLTGNDGDTREVLPGVSVDTQVDSTTENSVANQVVANADGGDIIVSNEGHVSDTLPEAPVEGDVTPIDVCSSEVAEKEVEKDVAVSESAVGEVAVIPTVGDGATIKETKTGTEDAHSDHNISIVVSTSEVAKCEVGKHDVEVAVPGVADGVATEENKRENEVAPSDGRDVCINVSTNEVAEGVELGKTDTEVAVHGAVVEVAAIRPVADGVTIEENKSEVEVATSGHVTSGTLVEKDGVENTETEVDISETVAEEVTVRGTASDGVCKEQVAATTAEVVANVEEVTETEVVSPEPAVEVTVNVPSIEVVDVTCVTDKNEVEPPDALPTEHVDITSEVEDVAPEQADISAEGSVHAESEVVEDSGLVITDMNLSVDDLDFSSSKSDDESMIDAILKVSRDSTGGVSMLDAIMNVSADTEKTTDVFDSDSNYVSMESSNDTLETIMPIETSETVVQSNQNGDAHDTTPEVEVIEKICNGDTLKGEMTANTCNGETPKVEMIENTCNGTTLSCPESGKSHRNSLIEYI